MTKKEFFDIENHLRFINSELKTEHFFLDEKLLSPVFIALILKRKTFFKDLRFFKKKKTFYIKNPNNQLFKILDRISVEAEISNTLQFYHVVVDCLTVTKILNNLKIFCMKE